MKLPSVSRRRFLYQSAAAIGFPTIIPATAIGRGRPAAEQVIGDDDANAWQSREQRKGYEIDA